MTPDALDQASIQRHSKSFALAAKLLSSSTRPHVEQLYRLCRAVDDIADRAQSGAEAARALAALLHAIDASEPHPWLDSLHALPGNIAQRHRYLRRLISAVSSDLQLVRIADEDALLDYAYGVAGSVGLLLMPVLGAHVEQAKIAAASLGMAMQLSNIARDVVEDAGLNR
ncbi:squalene/phytoene synthase family protein, partial [bacterium]|nr:squalene/phytoene synthase family protein [bacterium]